MKEYPIKPLFFSGYYCVIEVISGFAVCETSRLGDYNPHVDELCFFGPTFRGINGHPKEKTVKQRVTGALKDAVRKCMQLHRISINESTRMMVDGYEACSFSLI